MSFRDCLNDALKQGLLMNCTHDFTIRLLPPFLVNKAQVREFLSLFEKVLSQAPRVVPAAETSETRLSSPAAKSVASVSR